MKKVKDFGSLSIPKFSSLFRIGVQWEQSWVGFSFGKEGVATHDVPMGTFISISCLVWGW